MSAAPSDLRLRFNLAELAGAVGDLGTFLPIVAGMILLNGLQVTPVFLAFGAFYILAGLYYRMPIPVQPLKAVGAIAIAYPDRITPEVIGAAGIAFGVILLVLSLSGLIDRVAKLFTPPVVRGIQLGLGLIFLRRGIELIAASQLFLQGESAAPVWLNPALGVAAFIAVLLLLDSRKAPAALAVLLAGIVAGLAFGGVGRLDFSFGPTAITPVLPSPEAFADALMLLILPQIPLTIGNACVGTADTCCSLFPGHSALSRATAGRFALTMGLVNLPAGFVGAVPMCHGTGGLAAHYRFGARTGGAPVIMGVICLAIAFGLGSFGFSLLGLIPRAVLGVLLVFAGLELCPLVRNLKTNEEFFVALLIAGTALALPNMAWAFGAGMVADFVIRRFKVRI